MGQEMKIFFAVLLISMLSQCAFCEFTVMFVLPYPAPPLLNADLNGGVACRNDHIEENLVSS